MSPKDKRVNSLPTEYFPKSLRSPCAALCKGAFTVDGQHRQEALFKTTQLLHSCLVYENDSCCLKARCWLGFCFSKQLFKNQVQGFTKKVPVTQVSGTFFKPSPLWWNFPNLEKFTCKLKKKTPQWIALKAAIDICRTPPLRIMLTVNCLCQRQCAQIMCSSFLSVKLKCSMKMWEY